MIIPKPVAVGTFVYRVLYGFGLAPWERMVSSPMAEKISDALDQVENEMYGGADPPFGRALDLGCGRGLWSIELAQRGWDVTGIDAVENAFKAARKSVNEAGVDASFVMGDMRTLQEAGIGNNFSLVLDFGGVHGLDPTEYPAVGNGLTEITSPGAFLLVVAAKPGTQEWPLPRGMSKEDIIDTYQDWDILQSAEEAMQGLEGPTLGLYLLKKRI